MTSHTQSSVTGTNNENAHASQLSSKLPSINAQPKRALGDITNLNRRPTLLLPRPPSANTTKPTAPKSVLIPRPRQVAPLSLERRSECHANQPSASTATGSIEGLFETVHLPEAVADIDMFDNANELANASYAKDVYQNYFRLEKKYTVDSGYLSQQQDITPKMRAILVDWLVDVQQRFRLLPETLQLAVHILDRFLEKQPVSKRLLQLVGITSIFIAAKYEEVYMPSVAEFVLITDNSYTARDVFLMESAILNKLKFEVTAPYGLTFLDRTIKAMRAETGADMQKVNNAAQYLVELSLQDFELVKYPTSLRAAAASWLAANLCHVPFDWSETMEFYSGGYGEEEVKVCAKELERVLEHERDTNCLNRLTAIKRKFATDKYDNIATSLGGSQR